MLRIAILGCALVFAAGTALADDEAKEENRNPSSVADAGNMAKPSNEEVRRVMDYFNRGKEVLLTDRKFCKEIGKDAATKNDCVNEIAATEVKKGEKAFLWMSFMVPKEFKEGNLLIQFNQNGVTKSAKTREIKIQDGAMRYRVFELVPALNPGEYEAVLMLDANGTTTPIEKIALTVKPKA